MRVISALELHLKDILQQTSGHVRGGVSAGRDREI